MSRPMLVGSPAPGRKLWECGQLYCEARASHWWITHHVWAVSPDEALEKLLVLRVRAPVVSIKELK